MVIDSNINNNVTKYDYTNNDKRANDSNFDDNYDNDNDTTITNSNDNEGDASNNNSDNNNSNGNENDHYVIMMIITRQRQLSRW